MLASIDDERAITDLVHRYATGIDSRDYILFRSCWCDRIDADYGNGPDWRWSTGDAITRFMEQFHADMPLTMHSMSNIVLDDVAPDLVKGRTHVHAILKGRQGELLADVSGYYDDVFRRDAGAWKIAERRFTNVHTINNI